MISSDKSDCQKVCPHIELVFLLLFVPSEFEPLGLFLLSIVDVELSPLCDWSSRNLTAYPTAEADINKNTYTWLTRNMQNGILPLSSKIIYAFILSLYNCTSRNNKKCITLD